MFFLISKIGGTVLPNMTGTGLKCYPERFTSHNNPLMLACCLKNKKSNILLHFINSTLAPSPGAIKMV